MASSESDRTYRVGILSRIVGAGALLLAPLCVFIGGAAGGAAGIAVVTPFAVGWVVLNYRVYFVPRLVLSPSEVRVTNPFRAWRIPYSEVTDAYVPGFYGTQLNVHIDREDARTVRATGVKFSDADQVICEILERSAAMKGQASPRLSPSDVSGPPPLRTVVLRVWLLACALGVVVGAGLTIASGTLDPLLPTTGLGLVVGLIALRGLRAQERPSGS